MRRPLSLLATFGLLLTTACGSGSADPATSATAARPDGAATELERGSAPTSSSSAPTRTTPTEVAQPPRTASAAPRPDWLGTRVLPIDESTGIGVVSPTPPELVDRRLETPDHLPPPAADDFQATAGPVPPEVLERSTWSPQCPVEAESLRYVTLSFWGFDGDIHTGELLVHADAVDVIIAGFEALHSQRFPIEEMRITRPEELDAPPTGDGNNTSAFVCRPSVGASSWSQHAHGRAVDINPFHNPYVKGDLVIPELASSYTDRTDVRPGMLTAEDVAPFVDAGWHWGGTWTSASDPMHLSATGG